MTTAYGTRQRRTWLLVLVLLVALSVTFALPAGAKKNHTSSIYVNNGCGWWGYHNWGTGYAEAYTSEVDAPSIWCTSVQVKFRVNGYTWIDNDTSWASIQLSANIYSVSWSDHNADPSGAAPWVGFRMT